MKNVLRVVPNKTDKSILLTLDKAHFSLIWLHGLGDSSAGFLDFFQMEESPVFKGARVKLLHAPIRPVTINNGIPMPSWYDIREMGGNSPEAQKYDLEQIQQSCQIIKKHVDEEVAFWKDNGLQGSEEDISKRIFVGGFSQGCAMSLIFGLTHSVLMAGVVGFSGSLFQSFELRNKKTLPMLVYHGDRDDVIPIAYPKSKYEKHLSSLPNFKFKVIKNLAHSVCEEQLQESTEWMLQQLKASKLLV